MVLPKLRPAPSLIETRTCGQTKSGKHVPSKPKVGVPDKEVVRLVAHDMIREIIIPADEPNVYPAVIEKSEYERLKNQSKITTLQDRMELLEESEKKKNKAVQECLTRKELVHKWEKRREKGTKLKEAEAEAFRRANHLLHRAFELQQEQEDEIKKANKLILGTKCHAIRDAQIAEKKLIKKELEEEERRLDMMMEQERRRSLQKEELRKEKGAARKQEYVHNIRAQIKDNEVEKILSAERIEEESHLVNEVTMQLRMEEFEALKKRMDHREKVKQDLTEMNLQLKYCKEIEREEQRISELKIQEYMRQKAEREALREEELKMVRLAKEQEIARMRALQQRQQDVQSEMNTLKAQRIQDEVEREWRRKEKAAVCKKLEEEENLKKARAEQVLDRQRMQALEISREKREFERIIQVQREAAEKEAREEERRKRETDIHRQGILKQINEKEQERIRRRQEMFEDGIALKLEQEQREHHVKEIMKKKVAELRVHKVPEVYVKDVEKRLNITQVPNKPEKEV